MCLGFCFREETIEDFLWALRTFERAGAQESGRGRGLAPWPSTDHPWATAFSAAPTRRGSTGTGRGANVPRVLQSWDIWPPANHPLVEQLGHTWGRAALAPRQLPAFRSCVWGLWLCLFITPALELSSTAAKVSQAQRAACRWFWERGIPSRGMPGAKSCRVHV